MIPTRLEYQSRILHRIASFISSKLPTQRTWDRMAVFHAEIGWKPSLGATTGSTSESSEDWTSHAPRDG